MVFLTMLCTSLTYSQDVSGTVSDASGPLPGASVLVKGTTKGAQTDFDGKFTIKGVASNAVLVLWLAVSIRLKWIHAQWMRHVWLCCSNWVLTA